MNNNEEIGASRNGEASSGGERLESIAAEQVAKDSVLDDSDLRINKYEISVLEKNIHRFGQWTLIKWQKLTAAFCAKYILDEAYASYGEDTYICMGDILCHQPHLTRDEIVAECRKLEKIE